MLLTTTPVATLLPITVAADHIGRSHAMACLLHPWLIAGL